jgi:hypothetical protein
MLMQQLSRNTGVLLEAAVVDRAAAEVEAAAAEVAALGPVE